jgi:hypothetical protein
MHVARFHYQSIAWQEHASVSRQCSLPLMMKLLNGKKVSFVENFFFIPDDDGNIFSFFACMHSVIWNLLLDFTRTNACSSSALQFTRELDANDCFSFSLELPVFQDF